MSNNVVNVSASTFDTEVVKAETLVIADFWAPWCGPCKMVSPILDEIADEYAGKVKVAKINVDDEGELAQRFKVMSIPAIFFFKNGEVVDKAVGARAKSAFKEMIEQNL